MFKASAFVHRRQFSRQGNNIESILFVCTDLLYPPPFPPWQCWYVGGHTNTCNFVMGGTGGCHGIGISSFPIIPAVYGLRFFEFIAQASDIRHQVVFCCAPVREENACSVHITWWNGVLVVRARQARYAYHSATDKELYDATTSFSHKGFRFSQVTVRSHSGHSQVYSQVTVRSHKNQGFSNILIMKGFNLFQF